MTGAQSAGDLMLLPPSALTPDQLGQAARLVCQAMPQFYATVAADRAREIVAAEMLGPDNELSDCLCSVADNAVTGVLCAYPAATQAQRQRAGLHHFAGSLDRDEVAVFFAHLKALREQIGPIGPVSHYLARLAVSESCRGSPLATEILGALLDMAGIGGVSLHVHADNARAIAFYRKSGFVSVGDAKLDYLVMERR